MAQMVLTGIVQADGSILIKDAPGFRPGDEVRVHIEPSQTFEIPKGVSLEEAKRWMAEDHEMTPEEEAEYHMAHERLRNLIIEDSGLPDDYADEIDHYLYGTPKRGKSGE